MEDMNSNTQRLWFFFKGEQHRGPYSTEEMINLFNLEVIGPWDLVWREGMGSWRAFSEQEEFGALLGDVPQESAPEVAPLTQQPQLPNGPTPPELSAADEIDLALKEVDETVLPPLPAKEEVPAPPAQEKEIKIEIEEKEEEETEEEQEEKETAIATTNTGWGKVAAAIAFVLALVVSGFWFLTFDLQTYDLIGLEAADVDSFNRVLVEESQSHLVRMTTDGNVIWAAVPGIIEGEAHIKISSLPGRVLSTDPIELSARAQMVQSLAPFRRFDFTLGQQWVRGEYSYQLYIRPSGSLARLASVLAPVIGDSWDWVKIHSRGHTFTGTLTRFEGSARQFETDLVAFKEKIWESLSTPLVTRIEKYQTLERMALRLRGLWLGQLGRAKNGKDFSQFDRTYGREVAPVLQKLVLDSHRLAQAQQNQSPLIAHLFREIEQYGKEVGRVASELSALPREIKRIDSGNREQLRSQFEELWQPMAAPITQRLQALEDELVQLTKTYRPKSKE